MFTLRSMKPGVQISSGDVVIQMPDLMAEYANDVDLILSNYLWGATTSDGLFEGSVVYAAVSGVGKLANGHTELANVMPQMRPQVDNGGLSRDKFPGAGAITHYHNFSFYVAKAMSPGDEIVPNYGSGYDGKFPTDHNGIPRKSVKELRETGICLDNIRPSQSTNPQAGRGAVATRFLKKGEVIAPVPLIPIGSRKALRTRRTITVDSETREVETDQLFLNYCFGHRNSSLLLFPFSPVVNLVNHDSKHYNAKIQWSESLIHFGRDWLDWSLDKVKSIRRSGLLLELVATRDIQEGEEILIDYGRDWENAWNKHTANWKAKPLGKEYSYAYQLDKELYDLPTEADFSPSDALPANILIVCYYRYSDNREDVATGATTFEWKRTPHISLTESLRPCRLLRKEVDNVGNIFYTAEMTNGDHHVDQAERIPDGVSHVVTRIPRSAIRLVDKVYSSDQHLPDAFRHEIGIPDDMFPIQWMDLS